MLLKTFETSRFLIIWDIVLFKTLKISGSLKVSGKPDQKLSIWNDHDTSFCHLRRGSSRLDYAVEARLRSRGSITQSSLEYLRTYF